MATIHVTEFSDLSFDSRNNVVPVGNLSNVIGTTSVIYTTATQHTLDKRTRFVRLKPDADAYVAEGENPTATADSMPIEADVAEYFGVQPKGVTGRRLSFYDGTS